MQKVAIIGAGITGLTAAFELKEKGIDCTVFEASGRVGGCIQTVLEDGFLVECGPNSILDTHPNLGKLIARLGLEGNKLPSKPEANNRFIVRDGKPIALPTSPPAFFSSKAFSAKAKLRLMREPFITSKSNEQESLAEFVVRRLGQEFLDYAINPFVSGVYAGDPAKLATCHAFPKLYELEQKYGSLIKGAIKGSKERKQRTETASKDARMFTFDDGMEVLPKQLAAKLGDTVRLNTPVSSIQTLEEGIWLVNREEFSDVLIAIPAYAQTELNAPFDVDVFSEIYYPPVASLSLGFGLNQFMHPLNGFGVLIPKIEKRFSLGALFPSSIFAGRAPGGMALLTVFIGGSQSPERALMDEGEMLAEVLKDLHDLLGLDGEPDFRHLSVWPKAIPQYVVGYEKYLNRMKQVEADFPGIHFAGHYRDGISVANSILSGINTAERIIKHEDTKDTKSL
ncbi:protoporphyrinogen oxidase [Pontiella sulfatireligans]|uniref:Coproporphyrinogen III oxidase n=1 Tax=Pontiella sulfatireligans TaxID=2750658 RepID=A0A6C2UI71_9BACT|nr:protoporphyrinogen oxidase [Pontiella sulfatireligans]VGO19890.1 Protoporphyrinogen oxidase [Pontiella sulfatireligans]